MQTGQLFAVTTTDGVHFTAACAQNAAIQENLVLPPAVGSSKRGASVVRGAILWSGQNLDWEFVLAGSKDALSNDPNSDRFLGRWRWAVADGVQVTGTTLYRYYIDGLGIYYEDEDPPVTDSSANAGWKLHLLVVPRSAAKVQYGLATGNFRLRLHLEPTAGY